MQHFDSVDALTTYVEGQSHQQRCKSLVEVGRASVRANSSDGAALQRIFCTMAQPSQVHYHRLLSAYAIRGVITEAQSQSATVEAAVWQAAVSLLNDPSEKIAQVVMSLLLKAHGTEKSGAPPSFFSPSAFLATARLSQFKSFALKLSRSGQQAVLTELYAAKTITDPVKQQYLLGLMTPADFEGLPEEEQRALDRAALRLLCCRHPAWVAQYLSQRVEAQVAATQTVDALLKQHVLNAYAFLSTHGARQHAFALFTATAHHLGFDHNELLNVLQQYFFSAFPAEVAHYLLDGQGSAMLTSFGSSSPLEMSLNRHAAKRLRTQTDLIVRMVDQGILQPPRRTPDNLPGEVRQHFYDTQRHKLTNRSGVMSSNVVEWLPRAADRTAEARANYDHRALQDRPQERIDYLQFLPLPESLKLADTFVKSNDVEVRIAVIRALVDALHYFPEHLEAALDFCLQRTKEQDPWKREMYEAWSNLPHGFWQRASACVTKEAFAEKMQQLVEATYSAKDLSDTTLYNLSQLLCNLLGPYPDFALPELLKVVDKQKSFDGSIACCDAFSFMATAYPQVLRRVTAKLLEVAQQFLKDGDYYSYTRILDVCLSKEMPHIPRVVLLRQQGSEEERARMEAAVKEALHAGLNCKDAFAARSAYEMYNRLFPRELPTFLPALLEKNLDWVTEEEVRKPVSNVLQGPLLDRLVQPFSDIPSGRFYHNEDSATLYVCELPLSHAYRWTAAQQQTYAASILHLIYGKSSMNLFQARGFVKALACMPSVSSTTSWTSPEGEAYSLLTLATQPHPEHGDYLQGFALQALGLCEGDATALTTLQAALAEPKTRMDALRALTKTLRRASSGEAVRVLEPLLTGTQVTAQKEALYLLGSKRDEVAYARLVRFAAERQLPMPEVDEEGNTLPSTTTATSVAPAAATTAAVADKDGQDGDTNASNTASKEKTAPPPPMHRDVRTALVATLFHFLDKPQVWAYYATILEKDCSGAEADGALEEDEANDTATDSESDHNSAHEEVEEEEGGEDAHEASEEQSEDTEEENDDVEEEAETTEEDEDAKEENLPCPSAAACEAMTTLPYINLRRPWQLTRYQTLLTGLLHHPNRQVRVAALHKLASVPPYASVELCKAAADYLDDCTNPHLVRSALQCMLRCTADETVPYVVSTILSVQADPSLDIVTNVFTSLAQSADAATEAKVNSILNGVVSQLLIARRQPGLMVRFIYAMPLAQLVPQLTALYDANLMHVGAAYAAVEGVRNDGCLRRSASAAADLEESMLRVHPLPLLRRIGLEVVVQRCRRDGWTDADRAVLETYRQDTDLWVSSDALVVRTK